VRVSGFDRGQGSYELCVRAVAQRCADGDRGNHAPAAPAPLPVDVFEPTAARLCPGVEDWWAFEPAAPATVGVEMWHAVDADLDVELLDAGGALLARDTSLSQDVCLLLPETPEGRYLVRVWSADGAGEADYELAVRTGGAPCPP